MSDKDITDFYFQSLYNLLINRVFTFTINRKRVSAEEFMNYSISNYRYGHMTMVEKALKTRLNVSRETLRSKRYV